MTSMSYDIGPDQVRLSYTYPSNSEMSENNASLINQGINGRRGFTIREPVDLSTDSTETIYNRVFRPQHQTCVSQAPEHYRLEANRLSTFHDWRYQHVVRKEDLARNGFIYTGTGDKVRCVYCNGQIRSWEHGDNVEQEHCRNYPHCPLLSSAPVGNLPLGQQGGNSAASSSMATPDARGVSGHDIDSVPSRGVYSGRPRHPHMSAEPDRLATYSSWPAQMKQKPEELAQAGLFYVADGDKVKCFHCDGLLYNWDPEDEPFVEHARWFPDCPYLRLVKGDNFVQDVQSGRADREGDSVLQTPAVLAVLHEGHSVECVQRALDEMKRRSGPNVDVTASSLLMTIMELEEDVTENVASSQDLKKLQEENEALRDKQLCKICMVRDVEVIFLPCKHLVCCAQCSAALIHCPICRKDIQGVDKVYMA